MSAISFLGDHAVQIANGIVVSKEIHPPGRYGYPECSCIPLHTLNVHTHITYTKHNTCTCTHLPQIHTHTHVHPTLHRSSESGALPLPGGLVSADKYFKPFELACKSNVPRIINTALDCIQASLSPPPPSLFRLIYLYSYCSTY